MKTKRYFILFFTAIAVLTIKSNQEPFKIILESKWKNLDCDPQKIKEFGGKWILVGSITFKKRSPEMIFLNELQLKWEGEPIKRLIGSLYEKNDTSNFLPIEKYLICDSVWKSSTQQMLLKFNRTLTLGAVNTLYLVLTIPENLEEKLKSGRFTLEHVSLPLAYQQYVKNSNLSLAINELTSTTQDTV